MNYLDVLKQGIYEHLISQDLVQKKQGLKQSGLIGLTDAIDGAELPKMLAEYLANAIRLKLEESKDEQDKVGMVNRILLEAGLPEDQLIVNQKELLTEVMSQERERLLEVSNKRTPRPLSGLRVSNLFTGGNSALSLGDELRREIASADEICFIVSFLKVSGVRLLLNELQAFCAREGAHLRIITTTYCGATEPKAIEQLAALPNTEIRISYNTDIERLHAKSYIFYRNTGMHTAYIGSSNLSKSAQTEGLEWNIRVTNVENPHIIKTAMATFDMYWDSPNFEDFRLGGMEKFSQEAKRNVLRRTSPDAVYQQYCILPHQKQILDKLRVEREDRGNYRNLVVAATGTGKTVISAFDYREFRRTCPRARLLFVAHREEILRQALGTYRSVLQDPNFGALWVGAAHPSSDNDFEALFVSVSMFNSRFDSVFGHLSPAYYDYIVIDEAHHSQASSYRSLLEYFAPKLLLGLTATPERMDGGDLRPDFGGRISAEIRLPQALQAGLLTPFQYLCVSDDTDLSGEELWSGKRFNVERLGERVSTAARARLIVDALRKYLADEGACRALCFCVNKQHADFMAEQLRKYDFKAESLTSDTPTEQRQQLARALRAGELQYLCVVDIFNEGVDIPEIDTVLFLRPTESLTIFLQQLGRGLRLAPGKTELTVLDFVAQANKKYDFASRFRALTLQPDKSIKEQIENGFTALPLGCSIVLERVAQQYILDNIQGALYNESRILRELRSYTSPPSLAQFVEHCGQDIRLLYKGGKCWSLLKRKANYIAYEDDEISKCLEREMGNLLHHNSRSFLCFVERFVSQGSIEQLEQEHPTYALMLYYVLFQKKVVDMGFATITAALALLFEPRYACFRAEVSEIVAYLLDNLSHKTAALAPDLFPGLELYGCYTREEVFTLVGRQTAEKQMQGPMSGVFKLEEHNAVLLFVTLNKSEKHFSPSTQYDDYLINEQSFHWQSKNTDAHNNAGGRLYTEQLKKGRKIILFVREEMQDAWGNTMPFHCFGFVDYVASQGNRPMDVTWKLQAPAMAQYLRAI